jgi:hypothetical protein
VGCIGHPVAVPVADVAAPMPSGCFPCIPGQGTILDRVVWHGNPLTIDEHLHPGRRHPVGRGATILLIATTVSPSVLQRRVDVMGISGRFETKQGDCYTELKLE